MSITRNDGGTPDFAGEQNSTFRSDVSDGIRDALPIVFAVAPFAAVFGAIALENGLSFGELLLTSMSIYAGASQFVMLDLLGQGVPAWSIVLTVFAVNFRHVLYSAAVGRHLSKFTTLQKMLAFFVLVDPQYAAAERRAGRDGLRPAYYFSFAAAIYVVWITSNCLGAAFGSLIEDPAAFGLDVILPVYFAGLVAGFHTRRGFGVILVISAAASTLAFHTIGSPWHITIGGLCGLAAAALLSRPNGEVSHG
jgi:predicted branched-subunit amino acid permease